MIEKVALGYEILVLLSSLKSCNFFVRHPFRSSSTALERAWPETFENGLTFCLTPRELGDIPS